MGRGFSDDEVERLLAGEVPHDDPELGAVSELVDEIRTRLGETPRQEQRAEHLRGMRKEHLRRSDTEPARDASSTVRTVAIAVVTAVTLAASSMAVGGTLPAPVQRTLARVLNRVRVELPDRPDNSFVKIPITWDGLADPMGDLFEVSKR